MPQIDTVADPAFFRTEKTASLPVKVDRKANVIFGASLMQIGDLNLGDARPWTVDAKTLDQAMKHGSKSRNGLKARFTHPNMSNDGMGSYLGRWKNLRIDGDTLRGDLHIADAAFTSPQGDLGTYVMDLAESDAEAFGVSLSTLLDTDDLRKFEKSHRDGDEDESPVKWPMRFAGVRAGDIVDEPAATRGGLFDLTTPDLRNLPAQATALLNTYFGDAEPDVIRGRVNSFLDKFLSKKENAMADQPASTESASEPVATTEPAANLSAATVPESVATTGTEDLAQAERNRCKQIRVLCDLAKCPERFNQFVDAGFSVDQVQDALKSLVAAKNPALSEVTPQSEPDPNAKYKAEFAAEPLYAKSMTLDQFIAMRRVDEGLDVLKAPMNVV